MFITFISQTAVAFLRFNAQLPLSCLLSDYFPFYPSFICAPNSLSLRKVAVWSNEAVLLYLMSVTCRPVKLLGLILYLSVVATVSWSPTPTNSFIADLQRKTWEIYIWCTHTPAHNIHNQGNCFHVWCQVQAGEAFHTLKFIHVRSLVKTHKHRCDIHWIQTQL